MKGKTRKQQQMGVAEGGPNWILIAGGALLSTLSIRLGYKLKQFTDNDNKPTNRIRNRDIIDNINNINGHNNHDETTGFVPAENGVIWASSPDRLELPSPCASDCGSDAFVAKRDAVVKLRQQVKRRDEMILEMQDRIAELQAQVARSAHLEAQLDAANRDLFDSEREVQRLRKAIADHCVGPAEGDRVEMLRREVSELKEVLQGKDYLLHSYKEQKSELSLKIVELQRRLDSSHLLDVS